ncbi:hypothetical protein BGZ88_005251, partial [Linnemannia elongata]
LLACSTDIQQSVHGCDFMLGSGMKYFSSLDPHIDGAACNKALAYHSELEMRRQLEQSALALMDIVRTVNDAYGTTEALMCGTTPTIPDAVSTIHYTMHTNFNETRADVEWCSLRDGCEFLMSWLGPCESVCWQYVALYTGFATLGDDLCIPPWDVESGRFRYHGLTLRNIIDMLCKFGPASTATWKSYLWNAMMRAVWVEYLEKTGAEIAKSTPQASKSDILKQCQSKGMMMHTIKIRTTGACFEGVLAAVLSSVGVARNETCECAILDASIGQAMAFDMTKDQMGIIAHDTTNTLAENLGSTEANSRRLVLRQTLYAVMQTSSINSLAADVCETFLFSGPVYPRYMERYKERNMSTRVEPSATLRRLVDHISDRRRLDIVA